MIPCILNKTAVTQETDHKYERFKTKFCSNLNYCCAKYCCIKSLSILTWIVELYVFGGKEPVTRVISCTNASALCFPKDACKKAWQKVGEVLLTKACLEYP